MDITSYLIVVSASLGIAYCLYRMFFPNTNFRQQRFFLLGSIVISLLLPLSHVSIEIGGRKGGITGLTPPTDIMQSSTGQPFIAEISLLRNIADYLPYIYIIVSAGFLVILVIQILRILHLYASSNRMTSGEIIIIKSVKVKSPFSFFTWVFLPENLIESEEMDSIIIHEKVHARHYHSIDNILLEVLTSFMWFNPFTWLMKRSLHLVHEYQADEGTIRAGIKKTRYQALLINHVADEKLINISSSFNNNLKKRMIMMTKSKNTEQGRSGIMKLLPVSAIMLFAVAVLNGVFIPSATAADGNQEKKQNNKDINQEIVVTGYGSKPRSSTHVKDTVNYIVDGVTVENLDNLSPDSIESVNVLKEDRTIIIRTKSYYRKHAPELKTTINTGSDKVLYLKDGKIISRKELETINPSDIEKIDVLKRKESIQEYTDKDFDGVILITTKK